MDQDEYPKPENQIMKPSPTEYEKLISYFKGEKAGHIVTNNK